MDPRYDLRRYRRFSSTDSTIVGGPRSPHVRWDGFQRTCQTYQSYPLMCLAPHMPRLVLLAPAIRAVARDPGPYSFHDHAHASVKSNYCQNEVTVTASADVPTLTGACLGVVYNITTGKSDGLDFLRASFDVRKVQYFPKRRPHNTTVLASRWVCGEGLWCSGRLILDHVLPLQRSRPTRSRL